MILRQRAFCGILEVLCTIQEGPLTNYGMTIARAHNILPRALAPLE